MIAKSPEAYGVQKDKQENEIETIINSIKNQQEGKISQLQSDHKNEINELKQQIDLIKNQQ